MKGEVITQEYYVKNERNINLLRDGYYKDLWTKGVSYARKHLHDLCPIFVELFLIGNLSAKEVENYILSTID